MNDDKRNHRCGERKDEEEAEETTSEMNIIDTIKPREISQEIFPSEKDIAGKIAGKNTAPNSEEENSP